MLDNKLITGIGLFKVIKCRCGFVSVSSAMKIFKCLKCKKSYQLVNKPTKKVISHFNVNILFSSDNAMLSGDYLRAYKKKNSIEDLSDFHTYKY